MNNELKKDYRFITPILGGVKYHEDEQDFALTPYLSIVRVSVDPTDVFGMALSWFRYSIYFAIGFYFPRTFKRINFRKGNSK